MTGPEHYTEAERLAVRVGTADDSRDDKALLTSLAQVHATLALAAATAYPAIVAYTGDETTFESRGWTNATAPKRAAS